MVAELKELENVNSKLSYGLSNTLEITVLKGILFSTHLSTNFFNKYTVMVNTNYIQSHRYTIWEPLIFCFFFHQCFITSTREMINTSHLGMWVLYDTVFMWICQCRCMPHVWCICGGQKSSDLLYLDCKQMCTAKCGFWDLKFGPLEQKQQTSPSMSSCQLLFQDHVY